MRRQGEPSAIPHPSLFKKNPRDKVVKEEGWRNGRPHSNGFRRSSTVETATSSSSPIPPTSFGPAALRVTALTSGVPAKKKSEPRALPSASLFQHTPSTWFGGGKDNAVKEEDWRNARLPPNIFQRMSTVGSSGTSLSKPKLFIARSRSSALNQYSRCPLSQRPTPGNFRSGRSPPASRSRSLSRGRSHEVILDAADDDRARRSPSKKSRSKSCQIRQNIRRFIVDNDSHAAFKSDITHDVADGRTTLTSKNRKSSRNKTSNSTRGCNSRSNNDTNDRSGLSRSSKRCARGRSRSSNRDNDKSQSIKSRSVSRGSQCGSSQMILCHTNKLRVANMPFNDQHKREGSYTGDINHYGQPDGCGTLRYDDGTAVSGQWKNGYFEAMEANASSRPGDFRGRRLMGSI